ncbi:MAG: hypothetical protein UHU21_06830, partial [Lachnospiraceae bacterium]|nr:hypothetical protein [Lachnospiraceae bacterium]
YTANAATVSKRPAFANLSAWIIASHPKPHYFEKQQFISRTQQFLLRVFPWIGKPRSFLYK